VLSEFFKRFEARGDLDDTAVIFWSDHGINFGKYASSHDGEIEKMFPFAHVIVPSSVDPSMHKDLRAASDALTTPYDMYEVARSLLYYPERPPVFSHDPKNPPLPKPENSHIMASFQKKLDPVDLTRAELAAARSCWEANIPMEFCTCIPWRQTTERKYTKYVKLAIKAHQTLLQNYTVSDGVCHEVEFGKTVSMMVQLWPEEYKPKGKDQAKRIWMKPNRDMLRVQYETAEGDGHGLFSATFSIDKSDPDKYDVAHVDRLDAMKKKCGVTQKVQEQLCVCR